MGTWEGPVRRVLAAGEVVSASLFRRTGEREEEVRIKAEAGAHAWVAESAGTIDSRNVWLGRWHVCLSYRM